MERSNGHFAGQSDALLAAIIETAIDGIVIIDAHGIIQTLNPAAARLFGYLPEEVLGQNVKVLMGSPHREAHDDYIGHYQETGHARIIGIGREIEGRKKNGEMFPARLAVSEIKWDNLSIFAGFIHDLSDVKTAEKKILDLNAELEQKVRLRTDELQSAVNKLLSINKQLAHEVKVRESAENALRQTQADLEEALEKEKELNELKSRFVSMASHEFRTPLSTILSSTALISRYTETDQQSNRDKHLDKITSAVTTLNGILNDFLSLSKIEEGRLELKLEECSIGDMVQEVCEEIEGLTKKDQVIEMEDVSDNAVIVADKHVLRNMMYNLLSNAIKYSAESTLIHCRIWDDKDHVHVAVTDQGIGIPEADQKHLFSRFFRASNAVNIQGTGLGLNIVAGYMEKLGGSIDYESTQGEGSTFTLHLPKQ